MFFYLFFSTHSFANLCASVIWSGVIFRFPPLFGKHYGLDTEWYENGVKMDGPTVGLKSYFLSIKFV